MKPIIILPENSMSAEDIKILRDNELCVVVAKDPAKVRFTDPIPASSSRTEIENAAIKLSRKVLNPLTWSDRDYAKTFTAFFVEILLEGTPLGSGPTQKEKEDAVYNNEKIETIRCLAREDAKAEREAAKAEKVKADAAKQKLIK